MSMPLLHPPYRTIYTQFCRPPQSQWTPERFRALSERTKMDYQQALIYALSTARERSIQAVHDIFLDSDDMPPACVELWILTCFGFILITRDFIFDATASRLNVHGHPWHWTVRARFKPAGWDAEDELQRQRFLDIRGILN